MDNFVRVDRKKKTLNFHKKKSDQLDKFVGVDSQRKTEFS